ncbi:hypothetical protein F5Y12DRAFT_789471 [Xylaria sp. FL1777]|nr:hypothetical protein F5Y12DRAFT_789471 [Xylaria sp. FL1777]
MLSREEEGELLSIATEQGVDNIARYYHHETMVVRGKLNIQDAKSWLKPSSISAPMPPNKRPCSGSQTIYDSTGPSNREHRRVGCINGHKCLRGAGIFHRDISINNVMINEDKERPLGSKRQNWHKGFMAIGLLDDEQHSYMHDLESFFWVLFWICLH